MTDVQLIEVGEGGDLVLNGNDLGIINGYENALYLAMFGGKKWWGNYMVSKRPFASKTEEAIRTNPLSSTGRKTIEDAVKLDLDFIKNIGGSTDDITVKIVSKDTIEINIKIKGVLFIFSFNTAANALQIQTGRAYSDGYSDGYA